MRNQVKVNSKGNNSTTTVTCIAEQQQSKEINELLKLPVGELIQMFLYEKNLKNDAYGFIVSRNLHKQFFNF